MPGSSTAIGSAAIVLSASTDPLAAGLKDGQQKVKAWGSSIGNYLQSALSAGGGPLGSLAKIGSDIGNLIEWGAQKAKSGLTLAGTTIGGALGGPIGAAIGGAIGAAVGDLGTTVASALAHPMAKLNEFASATKNATALGIDPSQYLGISKVLGKVGIEGEGVNQVLSTMGKNVSDAANGYGRGFGKAADALNGLGLDLKTLVQLPVDEQFKTIATAIAKLPPGAEQAAAAMHVFGGVGAQLLPQLQRGGVGIQSFIDKLKSTGSIPADWQLKAASDASKAWNGAAASIKASWEGLQNRAALMAAPLIEAAGKAIDASWANVQPIFDRLGTALEVTGFLGGEAFKAIQAGLADSTGSANEFWGSLGLGQESIYKLRMSFEHFDIFVIELFRTMAKDATYCWGVIDSGASAITFVGGAFIEVMAKVNDVLLKIADVAKMLPDELKPDWLDGWLDAQKKANDELKDFGKALQDVSKEATDKWADNLPGVDRFFDAAKDRWSQRNKKNPFEIKAKPDWGMAPLDNKPGKDGKLLAGAFEQDSTQAYSVVANYQSQGLVSFGDGLKKVVDEVRKGNDIAKRVLDVLSKLHTPDEF